jgi:prevent-host-death family protein
MKTVAVRELQKKLKECIDDAQRDRIVITRRGRPAAVIVGVEGHDWERIVLETSASFWRFIEKRRAQPTISMKKLKASLKKR